MEYWDILSTRIGFVLPRLFACPIHHNSFSIRHLPLLPACANWVCFAQSPPGTPISRSTRWQELALFCTNALAGWQRQGRRPWRWSCARETRHRQAPKTPLDAATRTLLNTGLCGFTPCRALCRPWWTGRAGRRRRPYHPKWEHCRAGIPPVSCRRRPRRPAAARLTARVG